MSNDNSKIDDETTVALQEAQALEAMFSTSGWVVAQRAFDECVGVLSDSRTIDEKLDPLEFGQEARARMKIVKAMETWLSDLKGRVNNVKHLTTEEPESNLMTRR